MINKAANGHDTGGKVPSQVDNMNMGNAWKNLDLKKMKQQNMVQTL